MIQKFSKTVAVDASGDASTTLGLEVAGHLVAIEYLKIDYANGVDFDITSGTQNLWAEDNVNASERIYPVVATALPTGVASTLTESRIPLAIEDEITIVIDEGGVSKSGTFHFYVDVDFVK